MGIKGPSSEIDARFICENLVERQMVVCCLHYWISTFRQDYTC
jgi:hypothetical protein